MSQPEWRAPFRVEIDFEQLIWQMLQITNTSFQSPEFYMEESHGKFGGRTESKSLSPVERFENNVLTLRNYILPEWVDDDDSKLLARFTDWAEKYRLWKPALEKFRKLHDEWEKGAKDPMLEPIEPLLPEKPTSYSQDLLACYDAETKAWQPWKLHQAIIRFLHRRDFFKRVNPIEAIEGTTEEPLEAPPATVGSQSGGTTVPTITRQ